MKRYLEQLKRKIFTVVFLGFIFMLTFGCSSSIKNQAVVKPFLAGLEAWPEAYRQNFRSMTTFTGKARVTIESQQFSGNVDLETYWIRPDKLFIQAEGPLGLDVGKIYVGSSRFIVYNQYNNHFTSGSVDDPYLNRLWLTNFTLKELKYAALGYAVQAEEALQLTDEFHGVFVTRVDDIEYRFVVNPESGLLERCEALRDSRVFMLQEFKNYQVVNGFYTPQLIQVTMPEQKERISIFYKNMEINQPIDPQKYHIDISTKVEQLNLN